MLNDPKWRHLLLGMDPDGMLLFLERIGYLFREDSVAEREEGDTLYYRNTATRAAFGQGRGRNESIHGVWRVRAAAPPRKA